MKSGEAVGGPARGVDREGRILAARWSVERLRRPAASELVWLGYAKPEIAEFECLACGAGGPKQGVLRADGRTLYLCAACASHQMHPPELPEPEVSGFARRLLLETALDPQGAASIAARALAGLAGGRLVDLGCSLGTVVDIVRHQPGWSAGGVDPGPLATLGAEALGARLVRGGTEAAQALLAQEPPCAVLLGLGALDRSADPLALLRIMAELAPKARWLLAVADAERLYTATDGTAIRRLVQTRLLIPSAVGLRRLFVRAGMKAPAIRRSGDMLWVEHGAAPPGPEAAAALLDRYIEARGQSWPADGSAAIGLQVAALERLVAVAAAPGGDWTGPRQLMGRLMPAMAASGEAARSVEAASPDALFRKAPACGSMLLMQAGLLHLHGGGPSTQALMCFELAALLAGHAAALAPRLLPEEAERHWAARFHAAQVSRALGDAPRAVAALRAIVADQQRSGAPSPVWAARAQAEADAADAAPEPAPPAAPPAAVAAAAVAGGARKTGRRRESRP